MKWNLIIQAVILMFLIALAASCSAGKEYTTRVFGKPKPTVKDSSVVAVRFLEMDSLNENGDMIVVNLPSETGEAESKPEESKSAPVPVKKEVVRSKKTRD